MSQSQSIEEIMQRIRAQVGKPAPSSAAQPVARDTAAKNETVEAILQRIRGQARGASAGPPVGETTPSATAGGEQMSPYQPKFHELSQLRIETDTAVDGSRQTGQLNPRRSGPINALIQLFKKVMRRSLTWYTRPLHLFQAGVIRALQQIIAILDNYRDQIQGLADRSNRQADIVQSSQSQLTAQLGSQAAQIESQNLRLQQLSQRTDAAFASYEKRLEEALRELAARNTASELSQRNAQQIEGLTAGLQAQRGELESQQLDLQAQREALQVHRDEFHALVTKLRQLTLQQRGRERDLRRILHTVEKSGIQRVAEEAVPVPPMFPSDVKGEFEFDYFLFEEQYRGDETDIRQRQQAYLEYFRGRNNVVDIGCGRGEFLEILRDNGISARGIELGTDQYLLCKEKGLDVAQQDLFEFLESVADESLGGIFSAQVIEHMTASDQLRYVSLAYQKTSPGSPVIFETINPECVYALVRNFMLDPTHVRPVHPETLHFAMESAKFRNVEIRFSGPATYKQIPPLRLDSNPEGLQEFNAALRGLNDFLFGYQDYAAIGWR